MTAGVTTPIQPTVLARATSASRVDAEPGGGAPLAAVASATVRPFAAPPASAGLRLVNRHTGEILELWRSDESGVPVLLLRGSVPPHGEGPPMHIHHCEDEDGRITAGTLSVQLGTRRFTLGAGGETRLPRGVPHRWWNERDETLAFQGVVRPLVDLDRFLQAMFEVANAGGPGRPPLFYLAHVALRHRQTQTMVGLPNAVQTLALRTIVLLGTMLGRYRGTGWPGCPARCTGAPPTKELSAPLTPPPESR